MKTVILKLLLVPAIVTATAAFGAEDTYYVQNVVDLNFSGGSLPDPSGQFGGRRFRERFQAMLPYAVIRGEGEAYVTGVSPRALAFEASVGAIVSIRAPAGQEVRGRLFWPKKDASGMVACSFSMPAQLGSLDNKRKFLDHKRQHYDALTGRNLPGSG